ncbi:MAG: TolC family protein [Bacteroides sp.]|nr:TolC family protein [Bacteroides sp.]
MTKLIAFLLLGICSSIVSQAQITIDECVAKAIDNYPAIKKYELLDATLDIDLSDINKSWLPRIGIYGQASVQNIVPSFPKMLTNVLDQMGQSVKGIGKFQYKAGVDVSQTIWDGGVSRARRELARNQEEVSQSMLDVELYSVRQRVESTYFAILLTEEQIEQSIVARNLLEKNLDKLKSMLRNGVAMQCDVDMVEAQLLTSDQNITQARSAVDGYRKVLEIFIGESLDGKTLARPLAEIPATGESARPELKLFEQRLAANQSALRVTDTSLMPRIGLFAQAYYGYPGFDYFKSMMNRDLSFNIMAGIKVSWSIDALYTRKNNTRRSSVNARDIITDRELFLFNTDMQATSQSEAIAGLRSLIKDDGKIISLRQNVRKAAESQLENGIIDTTALLSKISDENIARLNATLHEIQLLHEIYNLKYTLNK